MCSRSAILAKTASASDNEATQGTLVVFVGPIKLKLGTDPWVFALVFQSLTLIFFFIQSSFECVVLLTPFAAVKIFKLFGAFLLDRSPTMISVIASSHLLTSSLSGGSLERVR